MPNFHCIWVKKMWGLTLLEWNWIYPNVFSFWQILFLQRHMKRNVISLSLLSTTKFSHCSSFSLVKFSSVENCWKKFHCFSSQWSFPLQQHRWNFKHRWMYKYGCVDDGREQVVQYTTSHTRLHLDTMSAFELILILYGPRRRRRGYIFYKYRRVYWNAPHVTPKMQ